MSDAYRIVKLKAGSEIKAYKKFSGEIGAEMNHDDYINALIEEFGSPLTVLTRKQFSEKLHLAANQVRDKMKKATTSVAGLIVDKK